MDVKYDPKEYWEHRLSKKLDLTTVGHSGLGYVYNHWLYIILSWNIIHLALITEKSIKERYFIGSNKNEVRTIWES